MNYRPSEIKRLAWYLPLRLATYVIVALVAAIWLKIPATIQPQLIVYSGLTLVMALALAAERRYPFPGLIRAFVGLQLLAEIILESTIIFATGSTVSPLSALYVLTIVSAAMAYRLAGTLLVATLASAAFTYQGLLAWMNSGSEEIPLTSLWSAPDQLFYSIFIHLLIFYLVAFVSGFLAERLSTKDRELADTSQALKRARLETDEILRHLNSGVLSIDAFGHLIFFNRAAERILGYSEELVRGKHCLQVFSERMPLFAEALLDGIQRNRAHPRRELEIRNARGDLTPLGLSTSVLSEESGMIRGVIAIFSDLTEAKAMEAKIRAADRLAAVGELSASIAHEIRNPLAAISGSVEVLHREIQLTGDNARLMDLIVKESHRLSKILSEFLTYARIDRPAYRKVDLCHIVGDVIELIRHHESYNPKIDMTFESSEAVMYVSGDDDMIRQLLLNLALNACEAIQDAAGEIRFHVERIQDTSTVFLRVSDTGPGITKEHQEKIFQPFFSTKKQGTGLGLAIVHRICQSLKIGVAVDSEVGKGTTFTLALSAFGSNLETESSDTQYERQTVLS